MRSLKVRDCVKLLRAAGYRQTRQVGSHQTWEASNQQPLTLVFHGLKNAELTKGAVLEMKKRGIVR